MKVKNTVFYSLFIASFLILSIPCAAQNKSLKEQAKTEFKNEHYPQAISLLEQAAKETPDDPEIFYLLGFYTHYNAYDSRPLSGYDDTYSYKVFGYLDKALELKPDYGDAKYFYGAECSAKAFKYMQRYQADSLRYIYKKAYEKGAYPDWLLEFGRNFLNSCGQDAIVFTGGNPDFDACMYLQLNEDFRKDITLIPVGAYIDRAWYVSFLKKGLKDAVRSININLTDEQIQDMRPFKWDTTIVSIPLTDELKSRMKLTKDAVMRWRVKPDLLSNRKKQEDAKKIRTMLSPQRAMLLCIIESNKWERPICFSNGAVEEFLGGLNEFTRNCGLISELLPVKTEDTKWYADKAKLEQLLTNADNFKYLKNLPTSDIPRISGLTELYLSSALILTDMYYEENNIAGMRKLLEFCRQNLAVGRDKEAEAYYIDQLDKRSR